MQVRPAVRANSQTATTSFGAIYTATHYFNRGWIRVLPRGLMQLSRPSPLISLRKALRSPIVSSSIPPLSTPLHLRSRTAAATPSSLPRPPQTFHRTMASHTRQPSKGGNLPAANIKHAADNHHHEPRFVALPAAYVTTWTPCVRMCCASWRTDGYCSTQSRLRHHSQH